MQEWQGQLLPGERLAWSGRPARGFLLTAQDWYMIPFGLFFFCFSIVWITLASGATSAMPEQAHSGPVGYFWLFGVPFVLMGLFLVAGRFAVDAFLRGRTRYAVTDRRVLIARDGPFGSFTALDLERLPPVTLLPRADGSGTIRFGEASGFGSARSLGIWMPSTSPTPQFLAIDKAQTVFDLIQRAQRKQA